MSLLLSQRDLVNTYKKETCSNVSILSKIQPMPGDLARQIFKEEALEKPTQQVFIHLSHYLVCIVDPLKAASFTWPLYDSRAEKTYRSEFSNFLTHYCKLGVISPVVSSYFVNPGCFKVTKLMFQLSNLAVERALLTKMMKESQNKLYKEVTDNYKSGSKDFFEYIEKETCSMMNKFIIYQHKKQALLKICDVMKKKIVADEEKLASIKKNGILEELITSFLENHTYSDKIKIEIEKIPNVNKPVPLFDRWLNYVDEEISKMESKWDEIVSPFLEDAKHCQTSTNALILRHTGEMDKKAFMVEYDSKNDELNTSELESQVNSEQKYILKNIVKDERLNFPNLIRGFVISICFILKKTELGDDIYKINEYLETEKLNYSEMVSAMKILIDKVYSANSRLQPSPIRSFDQSLKELSDIPPLHDFSDLSWDTSQCHISFNTFTPLPTNKHQFNFQHKTRIPTFIKPKYNKQQHNITKSFITPHHHAQKQDLLSSLISTRFSSHDRPKLNMSQNLSMISQVTNRGNETIAECSTGFTKQQIQRLLSTKKTSSSKKYKFNSQRPDKVNIKKGGLFNESMETSNLFRSYSSPNLFEAREKGANARGRKLSIMHENSPCLLDVSGITAIESSSATGTPVRVINLDDSRRSLEVNVKPITYSPVEALEKKINHILIETEDLDNDISHEVTIIETPPLESSNKNTEVLQVTADTPNNIVHPIRKTSSIEKIINRFKKVRASVIPDNREDKIDFEAILEEKENIMNAVNVDVISANRVLLPDLLSPSCTVGTKKPTDVLDKLFFEMEEQERRKPRESLGTALGVDQTFLDQFDLID